MQKILIFGAHQSHVGDKAGGYIRLKQFLKYVPKSLKCILIDLEPPIYSEKFNLTLITFSIHAVIKKMFYDCFVIRIFIERVIIAANCYVIGNRVIKNELIEYIYVPMGELLHLYLPAILLKKRHPHIKLVIDILNFENLNIGLIQLIRRFRSAKNNLMTSFSLAIVHFVTFHITKMTINKADYVFTVSPYLVGEIKKIYSKDSIDYTPSGISINASPFKEFKSKKKYLGVYVGRVTEQKGMFNLLDAWEEVIKKFPKEKLAIAGLISKEDKEMLEKIISEKKLKSNIDIFRNISERKKIEILNQSRIFLHLANYEPLFPVIGILEGMSCGLPVIGYKMNVTSKIINNPHKNGIFFAENGNVEDVAEKIFSFIKETKNNKQKYSSISYKYAAQFSWEEIAQKEYKILMNFSK